MSCLLSGIVARRSRGLAACVLGGATLLTHASLYAEELGPTLLSYRAPEGCPEVAEFQRSVQRRSSRIRFVDEGSHDRELSIVLGKERDLTRGELRLIERDGTLRQRSVRFNTCAEAVEGLALITAVSLDPQSLLEPPTAEPPTAEPPTAEPPTAEPPKPFLETKPAAPLPVAASEPTPAPTPAPATTRGASVEASVGGAFSAVLRGLPEAAWGGTLFFDLASTSRAWFAPLARASFSHAERRGISLGDSKSNFALTLGTLAACPVRMGGSIFTARPCMFGSFGALRAWGSETNSPRAITRPYGAWGGSLLLFLKVSQVVELVGDVSAGTSLIRDRFSLGSALPSKPSALYLSNHVGVRFVFR
jgi:hypothetical protein